MNEKRLVGWEEIVEGRMSVGRKARAQAELLAAGFCVPEFVVVPASVISEYVRGGRSPFSELLPKIAREAVERLGSRAYAVRSCAASEDGEHSSQAGQFHTEVGVSPEELVPALQRVIGFATEKLRGDCSAFAVIIQVFIEPRWAGVTFTRHPVGGREMILEYVQGRGEEVVAGRISPERLAIFWTEDVPSCELPEFDCAVEQFKSIEEHFGFAQDIEWAIDETGWWIVQARPLTTMSREQYEQVKVLDAMVPRGTPFLYERTEICETVPRATPAAMKMLSRLYAAGGPIDRAYAAVGVAYESRDQFVNMGGWLYVDREAELRTLMPAWSYFKARNGKPSRATWSSAWRSWKNSFALARMRLEKPGVWEEKIRAAIIRAEPRTEAQAWEEFFLDYETIFAVNLRAQAAWTRAEQLLQRERFRVARLLSSSLRAEWGSISMVVAPHGLRGNGLDVSDMSVFTAQVESPCEDEDARVWWDGLPDWKRRLYTPALSFVSAYDSLRERGRWLTVFHVNRLRQYVSREEMMAVQSCGTEPPHRLTNIVWKEGERQMRGISSGRARGTLVTREHVRRGEDQILWTETLTPDLAPLLPSLRGIVAANGGTLSHLAILAREQHVPVVVDVDLGVAHVALGNRVEIDGDAGTLTCTRET